MTVFNERPQDEKSLRDWAERRRLYAEVIAKDGERLSSAGKWNAFDTHGRGIVCEGAYTCVVVAKEQTSAHPGFIAHINPEKQPLVKSGANSVLAFILEELVPKGVSEVNVYGMDEDLLHQVTQLLSQAGIATDITINTDTNVSFTVVVKGGQLQAWLE